MVYRKVFFKNTTNFQGFRGNNCYIEGDLRNRFKKPLNKPKPLVKAPGLYDLWFQRSNDIRHFLHISCNIELSKT